MTITPVSNERCADVDLVEEKGSVFFDFLASIFSWLTTHYNWGIESALYISKSGGHLVNRGAIEGIFSLDLSYTSISNRGYLGSSKGQLVIHADRLELLPGSTLAGDTIDLNARYIEIDGAKIIAKEALKVSLCQEIILRGLSPESPTWQVLDHLPSGCIKTITR